MEQKLPKLIIVIPCFNEEDAIPYTIEKLKSVLILLENKNIISNSSLLFFVDDGSTDNTFSILGNEYNNNPQKIKYIKFTRNFGNQSAIIAGLKIAYEKLDADCVITIDADLQQDETKIIDFIEKMNEGYDIVAGIKTERGKEPIWKRLTSFLYYKIMNISGVKITSNHSEYRLLSRYAIEQLLKYQENGIFLRGLLTELGLKTAFVEFKVNPRIYGKSKFSFPSLLKLGFRGLIAHTTHPLNIIFITGLIVTLCCFVVLSIAVILEFITPNGLPNVHFFEVWNTFLSGIELLCLGIIGQYVGQILLEVKQRPKYIIKEEKL